MQEVLVKNTKIFLLRIEKLYFLLGGSLFLEAAHLWQSGKFVKAFSFRALLPSSKLATSLPERGLKILLP